MALYRNALIILLTLTLAAPVAASARGASLDALLAEANQARTSDPARVDRLLQRIDGVIGDADARQRAQWQLLRAHRLITKGQTDDAVALLRQVVDAGGDIETRFLAASMLANSHAIKRQFEDALRVIDRMLAMRDRITDQALLQRGLMVAAIVYNQVGEYRLGLLYAEEVAANQPDARNRCASGGVRLEAHGGLARVAGDTLARQVLADCATAGEPIFSGFVRIHVAREWAGQGRTREAVELLEHNLDAVIGTGYPFLIGQYHGLLAEYRLTLGQDELARRHARLAISQRTPGESAQFVVAAYRVLYTLAERRGDAVPALALYRAYAEAEKAYTEDVRSRGMAYQVIRHQTVQQAQQIELLRQKNRLLELQGSVVAQRAQNRLVAVLLLVCLLGTIGCWAYRTKRLQMRMQRMAQTDPLTCISNRHHFSERALATLAACRRDGRVAALVMFDLDHFKQINDRFGHAAGDWALCQIAASCLPLCGPGTSFGRLGGEEFAILLPDCDADMARSTAEDAMVRFAGIVGGAVGDDVRLTASFGITDTRRSGDDLTRLLSHADRAMYEAKRAGRNRLCLFDETLGLATATATATATASVASAVALREATDAAGVSMAATPRRAAAV